MDDIIILLKRSLALVKEEKFLEAVDELRLILSMNINDELKKIVLFQLSVCLMRLDRYNEVEEYLLEYNDISEDLDVYIMLANLYAITDEKEKELAANEKVYEFDPENTMAIAKLILLREDSRENIECEIVELMDYLVENNKLGLIPEITRIRIAMRAYEMARKLIDVDKALKYFECCAATLSEEEKEKNLLYKHFLLAAFSFSYYSEYYNEDKQTDMMNEIFHGFKPERINSFEKDLSCLREINIGFISSDLRFHPVGRFLLSLFKDKTVNSGINYYCYHTVVEDKDKTDDEDEKNKDDVTVKLTSLADKFIDISKMEDDEAEEFILNDKLDILFDLNGVSNGGRRSLIARRLAPIQFTWIGFPCSCALKNVDYTIVDYVTDPPNYSERFYTEKLVYMSKTFLCYPTEMLDYENEPALKINEFPFKKNGYITFGSFVNGFKYTDNILKAWNEILKQVPNSRITIRIVSATPGEVSNNALKKRFAKNGIDVNRVDFLGFGRFDEYMTYYNDVDIILDTYPFNGATTTCEAFLMGVPVVSLYGKQHSSRVGLSMLKNVELGDLAACTYDEYIKKAVKLALDKERIETIKKNLRETFINSPLSDNVSFKIEFENVMRKIYIKYCVKEKKKIKTRTNAIKDNKELKRRILRGFFFIENLLYSQDDYDMLNYIKNELYVLQKAFIKPYLNSAKDDEELLIYAEYDKIIGLLFKEAEFTVIKQIVERCFLFLKNI